MKGKPSKRRKAEPNSKLELRQRAEQLHSARIPGSPVKTPENKDSLLHELEVHQIELEMQNAELRRAQQELQEARNRYLDLFDFAPVGYFVLDHYFLITEANLTGSRMLGLERNRLSGQRFTRFIAPSFKNTFHRCMVTITEHPEPVCELQMQKQDAILFDAELRVVAMTAEDRKLSFRVAVTDITQRKQAEEALAKAKGELEIKVQERTAELQQSIIEEKRLRNQLQGYARRITQVQEEERKRIAYELHDDTAQYLGILKMQINALAESDKIQNPEVLGKLKYLEKDADRAFNDVRRYSHELRPSVLEHMGLRASLEQIGEDINKLNHFKLEVEAEGREPKLSEEIKLGFFRIAQEAINNIRKHAKANKATIEVSFQKKQLVMQVVDDGTGFDVKAASTRGKKGSLGLMSMRERADLIGASLKIESRPHQGTTVRVEMPL